MRTLVTTPTWGGIAFSQPSGMVGVATGGSVSAFTSVDRNTIGTNGGEILTLTVVGAGTLPPVAINGVSCTGITLVNSTTITCATPVGLPVGGPYNMTCGGQTLANGIREVRQSYSNIIASTTFSSGVVSPFNTDVAPSCTVTSVTDTSFGHTKSALCSVNTVSPGDASVYYNASSSDFLDKDWYMLWEFRTDAATLAAIAGAGQIKNFLNRNTVGSGQPGWNMNGFGGDFNTSDCGYASRVDDGVLSPDSGAYGNAGNLFSGPAVTPGVVHQIIMYQRRDTGTSKGTTMDWYDGNWHTTATHSLLGENTAGVLYQPGVGIRYCQDQTTTPLQLWLGRIIIADGWPL